MSSRILYIQYTNPAAYPPLEHSSQILADADWKVLFLGTCSSGANSLKFPEYRNIVVRQIPSCASGWKQKIYYLWFVIWVLSWIVRWKPKFVYASDLLSCPVAYLISLLPRFKVVYHEHDSPCPNSHSLSKFIRICLYFRHLLAQRTVACILPNSERRNHFDDIVKKDNPSLYVWNCPLSSEAELPRESLDKDCSLWLYYHGNIGESLVPETILDALATLPEAVKLRLVGYVTLGQENYVSSLKEKASLLGIEHRIQWLDAMPRELLLQQCRNSNIGIAFMPKGTGNLNLQYCAGASNKAFDYLSCGLSLLVSDLPDWKDFYVKPGYGLACNPEDPESIAAQVRWYYEHPEAMRKMGEQGRQRILKEWNYETQFQPVKELLC